MAKSTYLREAERKANDLLRVYNPTDQDYVVEWDRRDGVKRFRVRSKQEEVLVRYIAEKYIHEMYSKIITEKSDKSIIVENQRRIERGMSKMDLWKEQPDFESRFYLPDQKQIDEIIALLYIGVEREYGIDAEMPEEPAAVDDKSLFDKTLESVQARKDAVPETHRVRSTVPETQVEVDARPDEGSAAGVPTTPPVDMPATALYRCDYPGCEFTTKHKIALHGHKQSHPDIEERKREAVERVSL